MNEKITAVTIFVLCFWLLFASDAMLDKLLKAERGEAHGGYR